MGLFKSGEEKAKKVREKEMEEWNQSYAKNLGLTLKDDLRIRGRLDEAIQSSYLSGDKALIVDADIIEELFPNFTPEDKLKIFYYGHWAHQLYSGKRIV